VACIISILVDVRIFLMASQIPQLQRKVEKPFNQQCNQNKNKLMPLESIRIMILRISWKRITHKRTSGII